MGFIMLGGGMKDTSRTRKFFVHPGVVRGGGYFTEEIFR